MKTWETDIHPDRIAEMQKADEIVNAIADIIVEPLTGTTQEKGIQVVENYEKIINLINDKQPYQLNFARMRKAMKALIASFGEQE